MKILMISTDRNLFLPDSEVRKRIIEYGNLTDELHIIVFAKKNGANEEAFGNVFLHPTSSHTRWCYIKDAIRVGRRLSGINIVSAQDPFETGLAGFFLAKKLHAKLQLQIHTDFLSSYFWKESLLNKIRVFVAKFLIPRADGIRVVSERIKKALIAKHWAPNYKISVLPVFVDTNRSNNVSTTIDLRKKYPQFDFLILMASRLTCEKNIGLALKAMRSIIPKSPRTGMIIVGEGPEEDMLKVQSQTYGLDHNVIFEPWSFDLSSYFQTVDVFLITSNYEGYGRTVIEAMNFGCPVIMTDVGLAGEILRDGENGVVIPVNDKNKLIEAITLMKDEEKRKNFAENAKKIIRAFYGKNEYLKRYKKTWDTCLIKNSSI